MSGSLTVCVSASPATVGEAVADTVLDALARSRSDFRRPLLGWPVGRSPRPDQFALPPEHLGPRRIAGERGAPLGRYFANTVLVAVLTTVGTVLSSVPVAYALARFQFPFRNALFVVFIAAMILPPQVTIVPLYVMFAHLHWVGTPAPLIVPNFFGDAYSIFLLRQFFLTVPQEYLDAARIDGAGEWQVLSRVFLPLVKPAIAAVALFSFFYAWNDFFNPLLYLGSNPSWSTLSVALASFRTAHSVEWNLTMSATMVFVIPVVILFFFAQRVFVQGITLTGVKG